MPADATTRGIPAELLAEMEQAARNAMTNRRDPEEMRQACERMDRVSEDIRRRHGVLDVGTAAIRELRDGA